MASIALRLIHLFKRRDKRRLPAQSCMLRFYWFDLTHRRIHSALDYQTPAAYATDRAPLATDAPRRLEHRRNT